jgi:phytoene desaturase
MTDQRDLCADPQAGARRRRVVRRGRHQQADRRHGPHFERLGGRCGWAIRSRASRRWATGDGRAHESGYERQVDAVACNADIVHSYRDLLKDSRSAPAQGGASWSASASRRRCSSSISACAAPSRASRTIDPVRPALSGPADRYLRHGVLPEDFSLYLHHPSATDPSRWRPRGIRPSMRWRRCRISASSRLDWASRPGAGGAHPRRDRAPADPRSQGADRDQVQLCAADFARDLNAHLGSAFSLEPILTQSAWFRVHNRDDAIRICISSAPAPIRARAFPAWSAPPRPRRPRGFDADGGSMK